MKHVQQLVCRSALVCLLPVGTGSSAATLPATTLPIGGHVTVGQASVAPSAASTLTINQSSQRAIIEWESFNLGSQATLNFVQPSSSAVTLNRVLGSQASQIEGKLNANGQVFLLNPNGVLFAKGAQVSVNSLLASSLGADDNAFMSGGALTLTGSGGQVSNAGQITAASGGFVALVGGQVSNSGQISAEQGSVVLAAGRQAVLDVSGDGLLYVTLPEGVSQALVENSGSLQAQGGRIQLSASAADALVSSAVNNSGVVQANSLVQRQGVIELSADVIHQAGSLEASGSQGGHISLSAKAVLQDGSVLAQGSAGAGGYIGLFASGELLQTNRSVMDVSGSSTGGTVVAGGGSKAYLSGQIQANGAQGGQVVLSAQQLTLGAAYVSADGSTQGGSVLVGGNLRSDGQGMQSLPKAKRVLVNASSRLSAQGAQGQVLVQGQTQTRFEGQAQAGSAAQAGFIGLSGQGGELSFSGHADPGLGGEVLLAADNFVSNSSSNSLSASELFNVGVGEHLIQLSQGHWVLASPGASFGGVIGSGKVALFDGSNGALLSVLYGSHVFDGNKQSITALNNGNFVVSSPLWDRAGLRDAGAVTWVDGNSGLSGAIATQNSLVGSQVDDRLGYGGVTALTNGNYVIASQFWSAGGLSNLGAVTWASGSSGLLGEVNEGNSLIGSHANDLVGQQGVRALSNGHYVASSARWDRDLYANAGAVTWGNGNTGTVGAVSAANSLTGSYKGHMVGSGGVTALSNGNYVVLSPNWRGSSQDKPAFGAVTWLPGDRATASVVSKDNSLVGLLAEDHIGSGGVIALSNGNYVVVSPQWGGLAGAVTWAPGDQSSTGFVGSHNSLTGNSNDQVGSGGVTALSNGDYVVASPQWGDGRGAVTWVNGSAMNNASVACDSQSCNSLVGSTGSDQLGSGGVVALNNGNYVVLSPNWGQGLSALTWASPAQDTHLTGEVSASNSLVGAHVGDALGSGGVIGLGNGDYVFASPKWDSDSATDAGLVLRANGSTGLTGTLTQALAQSQTHFMGSSEGAGVGQQVASLSEDAFVFSSLSSAGQFKVWLVDGQTHTSSWEQALAELAPAGARVHLKASQNITLNQGVTMASGAPTVLSPAALTLEAGQAITLNAVLASQASGADALVLSAGTNFVNNAGAQALSTPNGAWQIWAGSAAALQLGGLAYNFKQYGATYGLSTPAQTTGNGLFLRTSPVLWPVLSPLGESTQTLVKDYDGTSSANPKAVWLRAQGGLEGDDIRLTAAALDYAQAQPGSRLDVKASGLQWVAYEALSGVPVYGYQLGASTAVAQAVGTIKPVLSVKPELPSGPGSKSANPTGVPPQTFMPSTQSLPVDPNTVFAGLKLSSLSADEIMDILAARAEYKKNMLQEGIRQLERQPELADLPACESLQELQAGRVCLLTQAQQDQTASQAAQSRVQAARARIKTAALPQIERKVALVIGVNQYQDQKIPPLGNAVADAQAVAALLSRKLGYESVLLENASKSAVVTALNKLALELTPQDSVVIYYAGHGAQIEAAATPTGTGAGYWLLADSAGDDARTWLSNADIARFTGRLSASQVVVISDSCYSGALIGNEAAPSRAGKLDPQQVLTRKAVVMMSSGGNEPVFDDGRDGHSPFAWHLMQTLGAVANWSGGSDVFERVRFKVAKELPQRPRYAASRSAGHQEGADYLFEQRQFVNTP